MKSLFQEMSKRLSKILAWTNVVALEVMKSIQVLNILDFKANRAPHILNMEFKRRSSVRIFPKILA